MKYGEQKHVPLLEFIKKPGTQKIDFREKVKFQRKIAQYFRVISEMRIDMRFIFPCIKRRHWCGIVIWRFDKF